MKPSSTGQPVLVLGLGASGEAAAELLLGEGRAVVVIDASDAGRARAAAERLRHAGAEVRLGVPRDRAPDGAWSFAVVSPGVPVDSPWIAGLTAAGISVVSELELGWSRRGAARTVAITGSNGKSTAVKFLAESLVAAGLRAAAAGNCGPPACAAVRARGDLEWLVLEVSSFQLETCSAFRPDIGIVLNVQPNHLDRHGTLDAYRALKARVFANARPEDVCIAPSEAAAGLKALGGSRGRWIEFGSDPSAAARYAAGDLRLNGRPAVSIRGTYFDNEILGPSAAAVAAAAAVCGAEGGAVERAARAFVPLPHRLQTVAAANGIRYVNDSKATSMASMMAALRMTPGGVRLIAGGRAKENDFSAAKDLLALRVKKVYLIGESSDALVSAWSGAVECRKCGTMEAAVRQASDDARAGETVLLSPACTSFDQFENFEERGETFARCARENHPQRAR